MQEATANLVHPILAHGLNLRDRLEAGGALHLEREQTTLNDMLRAAEGAPAAGADAAFIGIPYALTCWLDEILIQYSPAAATWREHTLESARYGGDNGSWKFWEQARLAQAQPDALEVFRLCALLGFRGDLARNTAALREWLVASAACLAEHQKTAWHLPAELPPPTDISPLRGREKIQRLLFAFGLTLLGIVPLGAYLVARYLE